jgi:hypothetical protein
MDYLLFGLPKSIHGWNLSVITMWGMVSDGKITGAVLE